MGQFSHVFAWCSYCGSCVIEKAQDRLGNQHIATLMLAVEAGKQETRESLIQPKPPQRSIILQLLNLLQLVQKKRKKKPTTIVTC